MLFSMVGSLAIGESNRLTILSYDNSGEIKFDVDIEMEQGYWNTSSSRLWTKIRDLMHDELVEVYKDMRANGVTYEDIMHYMYDEQIARIPQSYFNQDYDIKYAPYADEYLGKAHGDGYQHMKRWLKKRFIFCDTLYDYAPSYNNDVLTIRANTLNEMNLTIETYTPLYQHVSFYNGNMEKIKITPGQPMTFKGFAQTETDQEVLIYGGSNIKKITGIQSMNPNSMLIGGATRLTELDISNCPILTIVNSNKANFSPHTYLNKLNMSNCPQLGGNLNVSNSPLLQEIDARNSAITGLLLPTSLRNLEVMRLPNTIQDLTLHDVSLLHTVELDEGNSLQNLSLSNCSNLTNCINFDLTKVPSISLDNSFDAEELYMSETTNLTLKNMPSLKRVIFTPNSEYSAFDINNVLNGANYKITTFNNPMMTDFITTAPHRLSYNNGEYGDITPNTAFTANTLDLADTQFQNIKFLCTTDVYNLKVPTTMKNFYCDSAMDIDTDVIDDASYEVIHEELIEPYTTNYESEVLLNDVTPNIIPSSANGSLIFNMYSNNTTQPTSTSPYMWDLTGLKLEDFYTYGMNNWVKPSEDSYVKNSTTQLYGAIGRYSGNTFRQMDTSDRRCISISPILVAEDVARIKITTSSKTSMYHYSSDDYDRSTGTVTTQGFGGGMTSGGTWIGNSAYPIGAGKNAIRLISFFDYTRVEWFDIATEDINGVESTTRFYMKDILIVTANEFREKPIIEELTYSNELAEIKSITMPQRMPGYSVRLVNADITPDEYPTMLYPKLIDTTLPITGKLDYTQYNGTSLAWAYAYTTRDVTIDPFDSRNIGQITHDYNKLYGTDFVDIVDVWVYKDTDVSKFSTNEAITTAYIEIDNNNQGSRIDEALAYYPNCTDLYLFDNNTATHLGSLASNTTSRGKIVNITLMDGHFENVTGMAWGIANFTALKSFNRIPPKVTDMNSTFYKCAALTIAPTIPNTVTNMEQCFRQCTSLTIVPNIGNSVIKLENTFNGCTSLTTAPIIPNGVTNMRYTFYDCKSLTQAPAIPQGVTSLENTFYGCSALTTAPNIPQGVTNMAATFYGCSSLTQAPTIPNGVTSMTSCFHSCTSLTIGATFEGTACKIEQLYRGCTNLISCSLPLGGKDYLNSYSDCVWGCWALTSITWLGEIDISFTASYLVHDSLPIETKKQAISDLIPEHLATTTATLTLGETYLAYLTEDEIAQATNKGWTLE